MPSSDIFDLETQLQASTWLNVEAGWTPARLKGRPVALFVFQMLCPACVSHSLPQARRLSGMVPKDRLAVIGLHSVFEHHAVMGVDALQVFAREYQLDFPIAVDRHGPGQATPLTMSALGLRGTPSLLLIDAGGQVVLNHFGAVDDLALGLVAGPLLAAL